MHHQAFSCIGITKVYRQTKALDNVGLTLERGRIYGLIGNNGAGKTTLMRIIMGLSFPTEGKISLFGEEDPKAVVRNRRRIGAMIENPIFNGNMTGACNLELLRVIHGIPGKEAVTASLSMLGLADKGNIAVRNYSLGMKQRLGIAGALLGKPELLVLDEPANGLDPSGIREIRKMLLALNHERQMTMLISSHYLEQLYQLATDYIILHHGKIIEQISQSQLTERCSRYVSIETDNPAAAVATLESNLEDIEIKVYPENEIRIFNFYGRTQQLSGELAAKRIAVRKIASVGISLEDYFTGLVGGDRRV